MKKNSTVILLYLVATCVVALAMGFSDVILGNYFKDAYNATAQQRGFIEIPRELPGIIAIFVIIFLSRLGDIRIAIIAHILSLIGIVTLAVWTPSFYTMTAVLFVFSLGMHSYMPLQDSLAMSLLGGDKNPNLGALLGKIKGLSTIFSLIAGGIVFIGFRLDAFSFKTPIKVPFLLAGFCLFIVIILFIIMYTKAKGDSQIPKSSKPVFRKRYKYYYILAVMHGVQKQIVIVYAPWLLIEILGVGADIFSALVMFSSFLGIFFMAYLGKWLDRFGVKTMLYADALSFIIVYLSFAFMAYNFHVGNFEKAGIAMVVTFVIFVLDRMSSQMGFIRSVYLNMITKDKSEILSTISFGISLDHVVAITCSYLCGLIWTYMGPHYVFIFAASFSLVNLVVAKLIPNLKRETVQ